MDPLYGWLIAGVALVVAEMIGISGIGLLFAGLGALATGVLVQTGLIAVENSVMQFIAFFAFTAFFAVLLWKIVKRSRFGHKNSYSNMIGDHATVAEGGLAKGTLGQVNWSGTIMRAELDKHAAQDTLSPGSAVVITAVNGTVLTVKPKA